MMNPERPRPPWPEFAGFEWDADNLSHLRRHSEFEIEQAFFHPGATVKFNRRHSTPDEPRWLLESWTLGGASIKVVFTRGKRDENLIRPITSW